MESVIQKLAGLINKRNVIDNEIAKLIGRPSNTGHIGEFIAATIFDIKLFPSARHMHADGTFRAGPLQGKSVNVKLYGKQEGILDINPNATVDFYLVLTGPKSKAKSSKGSTRPLVVDHVYLFESIKIIESISSRGIQVGKASSILPSEWDSAEIWPETANQLLPVNAEQIKELKLFNGVVST